ncbi:MAG: cytochrome c [Kiloniellales bacterium]|nr:cytochrome c [Kiloniellales bacterium]MDJ0980118.1 cytochrome c [Kiloniellales bacterium]
MRPMKIETLMARLGLAAALCLLAFGLSAAPASAGDELQQELVPGLDMWSEQRPTAPYWERPETEPDLMPRSKRHREFMRSGVPLEYRSSRNPYPAVQMAIDDGGRLYERHCAACHGVKGSGDGEAGMDLMPPPAFLSYLIKRPRSVDEYLIWTISEGGAQFGSDMPAFKETLTDREIWEIVTFMRADFPDVAEAQ